MIMIVRAIIRVLYKNIESKNKMKSCALFEHDDNR